MVKALTDFKVLTFDCYGTMIDWEGGIWDAFQPVLMASGRDDITRLIALEAFGIEESRQEAETPDLLYPLLLEKVHGAMAARLGLETDAELDRAFGQSVPHWPAFADSADALRQLKKHFKLVILSNVNRDGFAASNRKLGVEFDAVYTAQDVGSYKPNPKNFQYMLDRLASDFGLSKADILHTAQSIHHDHQCANDFAIANAWIDRQGLSKGGHWGATKKAARLPTTDFIFDSLGEMAEAVAAEG